MLPVTVIGFKGWFIKTGSGYYDRRGCRERAVRLEIFRRCNAALWQIPRFRVTIRTLGKSFRASTCSSRETTAITRNIVNIKLLRLPREISAVVAVYISVNLQARSPRFFLSLPLSPSFDDPLCIRKIGSSTPPLIEVSRALSCATIWHEDFASRNDFYSTPFNPPSPRGATLFTARTRSMDHHRRNTYTCLLRSYPPFFLYQRPRDITGSPSLYSECEGR